MADIKLARVDFRLIHGQIVVKWCKAFEADKIVVIDNVVAGDEFMLRVYASAVPAGVTVKAYDEAKALRLWNKNRFGDGKKVLILFKDLDTCCRIVRDGLELKSIQLGGIPQMQDRKMVKRAVFLGAKEMLLLKELHELGVEITAQLVPEDSEYNYDDIVKAYENS